MTKFDGLPKSPDGFSPEKCKKWKIIAKTPAICRQVAGGNAKKWNEILGCDGVKKRFVVFDFCRGSNHAKGGVIRHGFNHILISCNFV